MENVIEAVKNILLPELGKLGSRLDRIEGVIEEMSKRVGDVSK
jgi:hypothetical protein